MVKPMNEPVVKQELGVQYLCVFYLYICRLQLIKYTATRRAVSRKQSNILLGSLPQWFVQFV